MRNTMTIKKSLESRSRQRGAALILFAIGMLAVLGVAGLALDASHVMVSHSRLQNTIDASALAAAKMLSDTSDETQATAMAVSVFTANLSAAGNGELASIANPGNVVVEYSATQSPFSPGTTPADYVRVTYSDFRLPYWLSQVLPGIGGADAQVISASAVSGPSPTLGAACDLVPLIVCGDPDEGGPLWGYDDGEVTVLKGGSQSGSQSGPIGPGNFQLARLGGSGADIVRDNLAGGFEGCAVAGEGIPTEPGNSVGPVAQGINTRFGQYAGPISSSDGFLPDVIVEEQGSDLELDEATGNVTLDNGSTIVNSSADLDLSYDDYSGAVAAANYDFAPPDGAFNRRNLTVTIADCAGTNTGQTELPILGFGCYFLLQQVKQQGSEAEMYGEFIEACDAVGSFGPNPTIEPGPFLIQLYDDPDRHGS
jgi:Flp pilus assembly protein TadG